MKTLIATVLLTTTVFSTQASEWQNQSCYPSQIPENYSISAPTRRPRFKRRTILFTRFDIPQEVLQNIERKKIRCIGSQEENSQEKKDIESKRSLKKDDYP